MRSIGPGLDATTWVVNDPSSAVSVVAQTLQVSGGTGVDGQTTVNFIEQIEMGGALELQHGDVSFAGASTGRDRRVVCGSDFCGGMSGGLSSRTFRKRIDNSGPDQWISDWDGGRDDRRGIDMF